MPLSLEELKALREGKPENSYLIVCMAILGLFAFCGVCTLWLRVDVLEQAMQAMRAMQEKTSIQNPPTGSAVLVQGCIHSPWSDCAKVGDDIPYVAKETSPIITVRLKTAKKDECHDGKGRKYISTIDTKTNEFHDCSSSGDGLSTQIPLQEFVDLLDLKYIPATSTTSNQPAKLVK